jgi:hypothetical protein
MTSLTTTSTKWSEAQGRGSAPAVDPRIWLIASTIPPLKARFFDEKSFLRERWKTTNRRTAA